MVKKALLLFFLNLSLSYSFSQVKQIQLSQSDSVSSAKSGFLRVVRPVFFHDGASLASDSANFNQQLNTFDAFGHVVITQSDGTTIYSDLLNYNGNTKVAVLTNNVRLKDKEATLTTNYLTYNMATKIATYTSSGMINNGKDTLTSKTGYYFSGTRDAYFRKDVVINSKDAIIKSDTLRYNTGSKTAFFYGPTHIYGKDDTLYTENGKYNTESGQAESGKKSLYSQGSRTLRGDSLFYDRKAGYGRATGNITFRDTSDNVSLFGQLALYKKADESILVTKNPYAVMVTKDSSKVDSIWITADTLFSKKIPVRLLVPSGKPELKTEAELKDLENDAPVMIRPADSLQTTAALPKDTVKAALTDTARTRIMSFYNNVKIFKSDLQARADSVFYSDADSIIRCYSAPMIWTQGNQLSADTIYLQMRNKVLDNMLMNRNGFIVNTEGDSSKFNQARGKMITGIFKNSELSKIYIDGSAESVYYIKQDSAIVGLNRSLSARIEMQVRDNSPASTKLKRDIEVHYYPIEKIPEDTDILKGFIWKPKERPASKEEIIPATEVKKAAVTAPSARKASTPAPASPKK